MQVCTHRSCFVCVALQIQLAKSFNLIPGCDSFLITKGESKKINVPLDARKTEKFWFS
jgi:hypothetical protein